MQAQRNVTLIPNDNWGGAGLLGVTIRLDNYAGAEDRLIRVLTVEPQSPSAIAGLVAEHDFLLGTTHESLETTASLSGILRDNVDQVVEFYVYNTESDVVRTVALMPTLSWGGGGLLGAEVGVGYLHRLPHTVRQTSGASVERKVRYLGVRDGENNTTRKILELEPQLEMEPEPESSLSTDDAVEVTKAILEAKQQSALYENGAKPSQPAQASQNDAPKGSSAHAQDTLLGPDPTAPTVETVESDEEPQQAASVFARPPTERKVPPAFSFMPPPPKMTAYKS